MCTRHSVATDPVIVAVVVVVVVVVDVVVVVVIISIVHWVFRQGQVCGTHTART
jgi:hypothetical protein